MKAIALSLSLLALSGCLVGPNYHTPPTTMPASFVAQQPTTQPVAMVDVRRWWRSLGDPELDSLVDRAIAANPDLQISLMRLQEARSLEFAASGAELPAMEFSGAVARGSGSNSTKGRIAGPLNAGTNTAGLTEITEVAGFDAIWDLDLFGGLRRELEAAQYDTQAAAAARNDTLVSLVADVASTYMDSQAMRLQLQIAQSDVNAEQQSVNVVQARFKQGITNELDPALAQRELAAVESEIAPLNASAQQDQRRLAVLLGQFPQTLNAELNARAELPQMPRRIQPGLPVDLLRRRPDIRQAERELAASTARIGVATAALYPRIAVTGGVGVQGQGLGRTPLEAAFDGSIGPYAYWPLLDFGTLDALVEHQDYHTRALLFNYQAAVLAAVEQVDDAIANYDAEQDRLQNLDDALTSAQTAVRVATQRYNRGITNFLDVLDAQREYYALQNQDVQAQEQVVLQYITLYKAMGGGWENYQQIPAIRHPRPAIIAIIGGEAQQK